MFEGMSDDEEDFQSVSHSTQHQVSCTGKVTMPGGFSVLLCV